MATAPYLTDRLIRVSTGMRGGHLMFLKPFQNNRHFANVSVQLKRQF